jgi:hypothetical protein
VAKRPRSVCPARIRVRGEHVRAGGVSLGAGINSRNAATSMVQGKGLEYAYLIMLVPLAASGVLMLRGRRTYPTDVASAGGFDRRRPQADTRSSEHEVLTEPRDPRRDF